MNYAIVGSGKVGTALARQFARSGVTVGIANTRGPDSIAPLAQELGRHVVALSLQEALKAEVIILAVPFRAHTAVAQAGGNWAGKIVVDAMNTYGVSPEELQGRASSQVVASAFAGAQVVKTFNQLPAKLLGQDPAEAGGRRVMFVSSDDEAAATVMATLVSALGFAPVQLGTLEQSSALIGMGGPLILQNLIKLG